MLDLSIIIPVYNVEKYLDECLQSILPQLNEKIEIILVDDGSTDTSSVICDRYAENEFISVIHKQNGGLSSARNCGIDRAKGNYLFFVDSDDVLAENAVNNIISSLRNNSEVLYIGVDEKNETLKESVKPFSYYKFDEEKIFQAYDILGEFFGLAGLYLTLAQGKIVRKDFILKHSLYFKNGIYHEDDEWTSRLLVTNPTLCFLNFPCYIYRHRQNSITTFSDNEKILKKNADKIGFAKSLLNLFKGTNYYPQAIRYYSTYYMSALSACNKINPVKAKELYRNTSDLLNHLKFSESSKQKVIYYAYKLFGKGFAYEIITKKY